MNTGGGAFSTLCAVDRAVAFSRPIDEPQGRGQKAFAAGRHRHGPAVTHVFGHNQAQYAPPARAVAIFAAMKSAGPQGRLLRTF